VYSYQASVFFISCVWLSYSAIMFELAHKIKIILEIKQHDNDPLEFDQ
jgi:hypothetical protein